MELDKTTVVTVYFYIVKCNVNSTRMLTLIGLLIPAAFCAPEYVRDRLARAKSESEFARRANETKSGYRITSITPSDIDVGRSTIVKIQVEPIKSDFCTVKFGESIVKGFVDQSGVISVRAPPLKSGVYLVSFSYDKELWSNEKVVIFRPPLQSDMWILVFPVIVTLVLVGTILWCGTFGICSPNRPRVPQALARTKQPGPFDGVRNRLP